MPGYRAGAIDIGVTADQVRLLAHQVDAQIEGVNVDVRAAASDPDVSWDLRTGTAWLGFYNAWKTELLQAEENSWLTFGLGPEYERIREYQAQAKQWQEKVAAISGKKSSIPSIKDTTGNGLGDYMTIAAVGAAAALLLLFIVRR